LTTTKTEELQSCRLQTSTICNLCVGSWPILVDNTDALKTHIYCKNSQASAHSTELHLNP